MLWPWTDHQNSSPALLVISCDFKEAASPPRTATRTCRRSPGRTAFRSAQCGHQGARGIDMWETGAAGDHTIATRSITVAGLVTRRQLHVLPWQAELEEKASSCVTALLPAPADPHVPPFPPNAISALIKMSSWDSGGAADKGSKKQQSPSGDGAWSPGSRL